MAAAYYYIDYTNGNDSHTGLRIPAGDITSVSYNTVDSTADTIHFVDAALTGANDYINGSYFWNVTRGIGSLITDFVALTDTVTLGTAIAGMAAGDEYYILDSWKTTSKAATTLSTAGSIAYIRGGRTDTLAAVCSFTNDGTVDNRLSIIGCNVTQGIDPYHDASDTRPIITGAGNAYYLNFVGDDYWYLANLNIIGGTGNYSNTQYTAAGGLTVFGCIGNYFYNCIFRDASGATSANVVLVGAVDITFDTCLIYNGNNLNIIILSPISDIDGWDFPYGTTNLVFKSCSIYGGAQVTAIGMTVMASCSVFIDDCIFGSPSTNTIDISFPNSGNRCGIKQLYFRNTSFNSATKFSFVDANLYSRSIKIYEEDSAQVFGDSLVTYYYGTITKVTHPVRVGGATSCAYMVPITGVGIYNPLSLTNDFLPDFRVWCASGAQTVTVYILSETTWGGVYPTAAQLYLEAEYVTSDTTSAITRAKVVSTEVLAAANVHGGAETWLALTCAINPHVASFVNLKVNLGYYVAGNGVYVDIAPTIT